MTLPEAKTDAQATERDSSQVKKNMNLRDWIRAEHDTLTQSVETDILERVPAEKLIVRPHEGSNSIAWLLWHIARVQDVAVNTVVRAQPQVLASRDWNLGLVDARVGTAFSDEQVALFGEHVEIKPLIAYWRAVSAETAAWLTIFSLDGLDEVPDVEQRLASVSRIVSDAGAWLEKAWSGRPVATFVRMPAITHGCYHLGEMRTIRGQLGIRGR